MSATQKQIEALLAKLEPAVAKAFRDAIAQAKGRANIKQLEAAIQRGDIEAMMAAAGLTSGGWSNLQETIRNTYRMAGEFTAAADVPARLGFTFNMYNPRVQEWLSQRASYLINEELKQTQIEAIQEVLQAGYRAGRNPRSVALDIVGRIDATGRRRGGILGLHEPFAKAVKTARAELAELNPAYFQRMRRDRRFDKAIQRAIDTGTPLTETSINQIVNSYENRLLQLRGETIARTEVKMAFEASADESLMQVVEEGLTEADAIEKIWSATGDARTRPSHMAANGQRVKLNERFNVAGYRMLYPGDPSAPASETINCFLPDTPVAVLGLKGAIRSHYSGNIVKLRSSAGVELTVTANHPILTNRGWIAADELMKGDKLINHKIRNNFASPHPNVENRVAAAEELYSSLEFLGRTGRVSGSSVNLHGYQPTQEVDAVSLDPGLRNNFDSPLAQFFSQFTLAETDVNSGLFMFSRIAGQSNTGHPCASDGVMICCIEGLEISEVTGIEIAHYEGPVFNFETESGLILAAAIITHNCRCIVTHEVDFSRVRV